MKGELGMDEFQVIDNCLMIRLPEEVDHHKSAYISERADYYIVRQNVSHVVFDFEDTRFMDSSGVGIIMGRYKKISCFGGKVFAIHPDRQMKRILYMSGLNNILEIVED
jgi:stage II sporulation protein AA (anti-sigma F factor antagonist)